MEEEIDFAKYKYVLYARKSTTDESRQIRSIPAQITECEELVKRLGIKVIGEPIQETKSAKKPNRRPLFRKMINDIKKGTYDGILAWNPDRLARNMLEGGEIIDLIDQNIIKDLKFVTHHFTHDANGKMLLGMAFVLSKQYSDDLSQKVTRGNRDKFRVGMTHIPKHGYINEKGIYKPIKKMFELIREAWNMRVEEKSIESIVEYLNSNGYCRQIKSKDRKVKMTMQTLSTMFHDPFYYGVLTQAEQTVDLRKFPKYNFIPAVSEENYFRIQRLDYRKLKPNSPHKVAFYPIQRMVKCAFCGSTMFISPSSGNTQKYLYMRCDNKLCTRKKKSVRSKVVFNFVSKFLADGLNFTEKEYNDYYGSMVKLTDQNREKINRELLNCRGVLKQINTDIKDRGLRIVEYDKNDPIFEINSSHIGELIEQRDDLIKKIEKLSQSQREPETDRLTIEQFLNLSKNALLIIESANAEAKDLICREIFLNFFVDEEKVTNFTLKEPFATLLKGRSVNSSRG